MYILAYIRTFLERSEIFKLPRNVSQVFLHCIAAYAYALRLLCSLCEILSPRPFYVALAFGVETSRTTSFDQEHTVSTQRGPTILNSDGETIHSSYDVKASRYRELEE